MAFKVDKREDRKIKIHLKLVIRKKGVKAVQGARMMMMMRRRRRRRRRKPLQGWCVEEEARCKQVGRNFQGFH
jgi:hypothetical protein